MGGRWHSGHPGLAAVVAGLLSTLGCTAGPGDPQDTAQALAQALSDGDVTTLAFTDVSAQDAQASFDRLVAGMDAATGAVTVAGTTQQSTEDGERAVVTLEVEWDLDGVGPDERTWGYPTQAVLVPSTDADDPGWLVQWSPAIVHPALETAGVLTAERSQARRADIVTSMGSPLVTYRPVGRVGLDKVRVQGDLEAAARELAAVVGVDPDSYAATVLAAGEQAFVEAIVLREADVAAVAGDVAQVDGARVITDEIPLAPTREFARALLGTVGTATAETVDAADGAVAGTDLVGLSGLQARYDARLRGLPGYTVTVADGRDDVADDADAAPAPVLHEQPPVPGDELAVTLDPVLQQRADELLGDVTSPSAIVAMRPSTGELLAIASGPASEGYSTATVGQYPPGSVFKVVSALALLRAGTGPDDPLPCSPSTVVDGKVFVNYSDYPAQALGDITLATAFAQSCNTSFVDQVDVLTWEAVEAAAADLGVGTSRNLGVDTFDGSLGDPGTRVEQAAGLIGQGPVLVSPLVAASMAASTVAGAAPAVLLPGVSDGSPAGAEGALRESERQALALMMRQAVTDGTAQLLSTVPGAPVGAKTGTAEFGSDSPPDTHGWVVAVQGDLAAAVFVETAESGSATAAPLMRDLLAVAAGLPAP